jgi:hypothetical protein
MARMLQFRNNSIGEQVRRDRAAAMHNHAACVFAIAGHPNPALPG